MSMYPEEAGEERAKEECIDKMEETQAAFLCFVCGERTIGSNDTCASCAIPEKMEDLSMVQMLEEVGYMEDMRPLPKDKSFNSVMSMPPMDLIPGASTKVWGLDKDQIPTMEEELVISDGSTASYYELPTESYQLQDLISYKDMNAQIGEIFRACYRYGEVSHSGKLRDARKIKYYIEAEIERLTKEEYRNETNI